MREPFGTAIFCDDVRHELGDKTSYMGIYGADMTIDLKPPVMLPKLCIVVHISIPSKLSPSQMTIQVSREAGGANEILISMRGGFQKPEDFIPNDDDIIKTIAILNAVPFEVKEECIIKVSAFIDEYECEMDELQIRFAQN